jgi:hypothetical protein
MSSIFRGVAGILVLATTAAGCAEFQEQLTGKYGPSPVPTGAMVEAAVRRQSDVVFAIAQGAGYSQGAPPFGDRVGWYTVTMTGFNVVDDACMTYIDDLWILERRKARTGALLAATGAATAGIIAANSNPSSATLAILAQAFGLAAAFNTAISDSYLYTQNAATIKKLVRKTTEAYRTDFAKKLPPPENEITYPIGSPSAAYHHMREYLALCLPPTIQAQIEELVATAKATPENSPTDAALIAARARATAAVRPLVGTGGTTTSARSTTTSIRVQ